MSASLILRTIKGAPLTNYEVDNNFSNLNIWTNTVSANVGVLNNLTTTTKSNIVNSVNEVVTSIGVLSGLTTTQKSNLVAAINEVVTESTSNVSITGGTITGVANLASSGNVYGNYYFGNGSLLTGISVDTTRIISGTTVFSILSTNGNISGNIAGTQVLTIAKDGASTANIQVLGNITSTVTKTSNLQDSSGRTLKILNESNTVIWGG